MYQQSVFAQELQSGTYRFLVCFLSTFPISSHADSNLNIMPSLNSRLHFTSHAGQGCGRSIPDSAGRDKVRSKEPVVHVASSQTCTRLNGS